MEVIIQRIRQNAVVTLGTLSIIDDTRLNIFNCKTLELPWKNNARGISCIQAGKYTCRKYHSEKFGDCFHIENVLNRDGILIHAGNTTHDTKGCILVGRLISCVGKRKEYFVNKSSLCLEDLLIILPQSFYLTIKD